MKIKKEIVNNIFKQGEREKPNEACGYLAGENDELIKYYPMKNMDKSSEHFTLDPKEQFEVIKKARSDGKKVLAVYHTHPASPARPSDEDIRLAYDPNIIYVIASLVDQKNIKAFKIINSKVQEVELEVI